MHLGPEQKTQAWLDARLKVITCSDIAAVIGHSKYADWRTVMNKKLGITKRGPMNRAMQRGCELEDEAIERYEAKMQRPVVWMDAGLQIHQKYPFLGGSPDGITYEGRLIEIKGPLYRKIIMGVVPGHYLPQIQFLLEIYDLEVCDFIDYLPERDRKDGGKGDILNVVEVKRDREFVKTHLDTLRLFVQKMVHCRRAIQEGRPYCLRDDEMSIPLTPEEKQIFSQLVRVPEPVHSKKSKRARKFAFVE